MAQAVHIRQHPGYVHVVDVPDDFRIDKFDWPTSGSPDSADGGAGVWMRVWGGGIPVPLAVRVDRAQDGRFVITGMLIGHEDRREIDWSALRQIKPASIISMIFAGFDPQRPHSAVTRAWDANWTTAARTGTDELEQFAHLEAVDEVYLEPDSHPLARKANALARAIFAQHIWENTGGNRAAVPEVAEAHRPRASVATNLTEFAETYLRNFATDPQRATQATADELHVSRATAVRRIKECRDIGLIPPRRKP